MVTPFGTRQSSQNTETRFGVHTYQRRTHVFFTAFNWVSGKGHEDTNDGLSTIGGHSLAGSTAGGLPDSGEFVTSNSEPTRKHSLYVKNMHKTANSGSG